MKLLFIKSLFIRNKNFIQLNLDSISNFTEYLKKSSNKYDLIVIKLIGWINPEIGTYSYSETIAKIEKIKVDIESNYKNIYLEYEIWGDNKGKSYLIKNLKIIYPQYRLYNHILYADHDISPIDDILCERFIVNNMINDKKILMVSFSQEPDNKHNTSIFKNKITLFDRGYFYNNDNVLIASGCFITIPDLIPLFSELDINPKNIYGDEDILIGNMVNRNNSYNIVSSLRVNHPFDIDLEYAEWKKNKLFEIAKQI